MAKRITKPRYAAEHRQRRIAELNRLIDAGGELGRAARLSKKASTVVWTGRISKRTHGTWKRKHSRPGAVVMV